MYDPEIANSVKLRPWQQDLMDLITNYESMFRDRKVIYVEDKVGGSGKSTFVKWLRIGQVKFSFRPMQHTRADRVDAAINKIYPKEKLDIVGFDLTRERGSGQTDKELFSIAKKVKDGYVIDEMFGNHKEAIWKFGEEPIVIIFSNKPFQEVRKYLSWDRWFVCQPSSEGLIVSDKGAIHPGAVKPINFKLLKNSSYGAGTLQEQDKDFNDDLKTFR